MHASFSATPQSHAHACRITEALCEGFVLAMMAEFDAEPPDTYPCCVRCGGFCVHEGPGCPSTHVPLSELLGQPEQPLNASLCRESGDTGAPPPGTLALRVRSPKQIVRSGGGTTLELACYQVALKRLEGVDPGCRVVVVECDPGMFRAVCVNSHAHRDEEKKGIIDDPVVHANSQVACSCDPAAMAAHKADGNDPVDDFYDTSENNGVY